MTTIMNKKTKLGKIIKICDSHTVKVRVEWKKKHPKYHKKYIVSQNFLVDSNNNKFNLGQAVTISESKPISKNKHFRVVNLSK